MMRLFAVGAVTALLAAAQLALPGTARADAKNRTAVALDSQTFVTVKDDVEWEYVHLYRVEGGKLVLIDSVAVRQDNQVDRMIEFRRMSIDQKGD